jgi:hypothetical protein
VPAASGLETEAIPGYGGTGFQKRSNGENGENGENGGNGEDIMVCSHKNTGILRFLRYLRCSVF